MRVKYIGRSNPLALLHGKEYLVVSTECGWYRIADESNEDYLYPPYLFTVVEALPIPPEVTPEPMPYDENFTLEDFGVLTAWSKADHSLDYDLRAIVNHCESNGIDSSKLTDEELVRFDRRMDDRRNA